MLISIALTFGVDFSTRSISHATGSAFGKYPSPLYYDWDGDGDGDLIIAYWNTSSNKGQLSLYENVGTRLSPSFSYKEELKADGAVIKLVAI